MEWTWFYSIIDEMTMNFSDPFLTVAKGMYVALGALILLIYSSKWSVIAEESIGGLLHFVSLLCVVGFMLGNYNIGHPPPIGIGVPIKTLIPNMVSGLADIMELSRLDEASKRCLFIIDHLESPKIDIFNGIIDVHAFLAYIVISIVMTLLGIFIMLPMMVAIIFLGIGGVIWPLFIPWLMIPRMSWLFWNALTYMLKYSFYRLFAVAIVYVISGILVHAIDRSLSLDLQTQIAGHTVQQYSLSQMTAETILRIVLVLPLSIWAIKELPNALSQLFSGGASAGASLMKDITSTVFKK